jgi:C_GCAxxG_C_C family probable redox protein
MKIQQYIQEKVQKYYQEDDINCATANLKILANQFDVVLNQQVINAAIGMHGAGSYGAQCGLVEGMLMFLGILGRANSYSEKRIAEICKTYASTFEKEFGSLLCSSLRPEGFGPEVPPHWCTNITEKAIFFNFNFIKNHLFK